MRTQQLLTSLPPKDWEVRQVIVFDWCDGPRQGVASLARPECEFEFDLLAERHNPDGLDDRLFRVSELPAGSVTKILEVLHSLGSPSNRVWIPVWKFDTEEERQRADQAIDRVLSQRRDTEVVIYSRDMTTFLGCWQDERASDQVRDWFSVLPIS